MKSNKKIILLVLFSVTLVQLGASLIEAAEVRKGAPEVSILKALPNPVVVFVGSEKYQANGQNFVRYKLSVTNYSVYPAAMFAPAPNLPPCGANKSSSRTWVNIYQATSKAYIYGFCAFNSSGDLTGLWFAVQAGQPVPSPVVVVLDDRQLNKNYVSNAVTIRSMPLANFPKVTKPTAGLATGSPPKVTYQIHCGFNESSHQGECSCNQNKEGECNDMFENYCKEGGSASCDNGKGTCSCEMKL
ncbi:MAG TPA: hypothetical protein VIB79_29930 [Candidatus Binatia bacterium]|jgi:hypothetical protein